MSYQTYLQQAVSNTQDIIYSRDVIERIIELEDAYPVADSAMTEELDSLRKLAEQCAPYVDDWDDGATLIRDTYFKEYAQELAEDLDLIDRRASWPRNCIDWDMAARELQMDYTAVDFDGVTYWVR